MWYQPSARRLGVLPVAEEAARTASQDLAVVCDPHLDAGDRLPHRSEDVPLRSREGHHRTHLRGPVALQDVDAHVGPASGDVDVEGRRPDADGVEASAELRQDPSEEQSPDRLGGAARDGVELLERCPSPGLVDPPLDRGVEQPQTLGHDEQRGYAEVAEGPDQDRRLAADRVDHAGADDERREEAEHLLVQV